MSQLEESPEMDEDIPTRDVHYLLSNERRRLILQQLREDNEPINARDLSEFIAKQETGQDPPPRNIRQSAYVSLHQTHLPKLDEFGIIEYDSQSKLVRLNDEAKQITMFMETDPRHGISWSEFYICVSLVGLLLVTGAGFGLPILSLLPPAIWAGVMLIVIGASGAYQVYQQESSILHRLWDSMGVFL